MTEKEEEEEEDEEEKEGRCACVGKTIAKNYLSCMSIISAWIRLEIITEIFPTNCQTEGQ